MRPAQAPGLRAKWLGGLELLVPLVPIAVLLLLGPLGPWGAIVVTAAAGASVYLVGRLGSGRFDEWAAVPVILALAYGAVAAPAGAAEAVTAGIGGLGVLYWLSRDRLSVARARDSALALALPAAALALALTSASLLPAPSAAVGLAAGIVVAVLLLMAWLYRSSTMGMPEAPSSY